MLVGVLSFTILKILTILQTPRTPPGARQTRVMANESRADQVSMTAEQLSKYNGAGDGSIYMAVQDPFSDEVTIFDMTSGKDFYGPGGPYHVFAGKNASHGLAKSSTDSTQVTGDLGQLSEHEKDTHMQWYTKFSSKYPKIGKLVSNVAAEETKKDI